MSSLQELIIFQDRFDGRHVYRLFVGFMVRTKAFRHPIYAIPRQFGISSYTLDLE
jgi:hypothetical protein